MTKKGMALNGEGDYRGALAHLSRAVMFSRRIGVPMHEAKIRNNIALVLAEMGRPDLAIKQIDRALKMVEAKLGRDNRFYNFLHANHQAIAELPAQKAA